MLEPEVVKVKISQAITKGTDAFLKRGGFSNKNAFYLSFADNDRWLGGCYIRADSIDEASVLSHILKINPGGSVQTTGPFPVTALKLEYEHRLLNREEIDEALDESKL